MHILYVSADSAQEKNVDVWRIEKPAAALAKAGHQARIITNAEFNQRLADPLCQQADLIVVERHLYGETLQTIAYWQAGGKPVLADFDDAYDQVPPTNPAYPFWRLGLITDAQGHTRAKPGLMPLEEFSQGLRMVTAATMPSRLLVADWAKRTRTYYLPNYIDTRPYLDALHTIKARQPGDPVVIGWGGSVSHLQSFTGSGILPALVRVCAQRPQVRVVICGDERIARHLPIKNLEVKPWAPYAEWPQTLAWFDIGLAPLAGEFDDRRSWIKPLEYLTMGIPFLASLSPAYRELYPVTPNFVENNAMTWESALLDRIDHLADYAQAAARQQAFALEQDVFANAQNIMKVYEEILR